MNKQMRLHNPTPHYGGKLHCLSRPEPFGLHPSSVVNNNLSWVKKIKHNFKAVIIA